MKNRNIDVTILYNKHGNIKIVTNVKIGELKAFKILWHKNAIFR